MCFGHTSKSCKICCWKLQGDSYVLPLLWRGTSVKVSCPASQTKSQTVDPPSVCCSHYGVIVRLHKVSSLEELRLNGKHRNSVSISVLWKCHFQELISRVFKIILFFFFNYSQRRMDPSGDVGRAMWLHYRQTRCRHCLLRPIYYMWHHSKGKFHKRQKTSEHFI